LSSTRSKSAKVRHMLVTGTHTVAHISKVTKASPQLVYAMRAKIKKEDIAGSFKPGKLVFRAEGQPVVSPTGIASYTKTIPIPTPPASLWQRVVNFFKGSNHA